MTEPTKRLQELHDEIGACEYELAPHYLREVISESIDSINSHIEHINMVISGHKEYIADIEKVSMTRDKALWMAMQKIYGQKYMGQAYENIMNEAEAELKLAGGLSDE